MSPFLVSFMFGIGVGAWVYNKVQKRNGGQSQQSLVVAGGAALAAFIVFLTMFTTFLPD